MVEACRGGTITARIDAIPEPKGGDEFDRLKSFALRVTSDKKGAKTVRRRGSIKKRGR